MAQPTRSQIHVDKVLEGFSRAYIQRRSSFIWRDAMPSFGVPASSGKYFRYTQKYWLMRMMERRARGGPSARSGFELDTATYALDMWSLEKAIADEDKDEADRPIDLDQDAAEWLELQNDINGEVLFAAAFMGDVWGTNNTSATDWDTTSTPVVDVQTAQRTIQQNTGMMANAIMMGKIVADALETNAEILDKIKYTQRALRRDVRALLGMALGLDNIYVSEGAYDTAAEGVTASISPIIDDDAVVYYRAPQMLQKKTATAGALFYWLAGGGLGMMDRYREEKVKSDIARITAYYDHFVIGSELGYRFEDIV